MGRNILARLSAESTDKDFGAAASFMIGFSSRISPELLQDLYRALKGKKAASKALKTVENDYHNEIEISLEDCAAYIERIYWQRLQTSFGMKPLPVFSMFCRGL